MSDRIKQLADVAQVAVLVERETRVPAQAIVSQWALESKWGDKPVGHANYFGMKKADRHKLFVLRPTHEVFTQAQIDDWNRKHPDRPAKVFNPTPDGRFYVEISDEFADYPDLMASALDYAWLISHGEPYAEGWREYLQGGSVNGLITAIAKHYATGIGYAQFACTIANQNNVVQAIAAARQKV